MKILPLLVILSVIANTAMGQSHRNNFATTNQADVLTNVVKSVANLRSFTTPQDYGAVGDGVTDDSAALKAWLFTATSSNLIALLPPAPGGSYACSTTLLITNFMNHIFVLGAGGAMFNSDGPTVNKACINFTTASDGIRVTNVQSNVRFDGIRVTNSAAYSFATHGIWFDGSTGDSDNSSIRNCSVQGFGRGLMLSSVADTTVENCSFGVNGIGVEIAGGTYANPPVINQPRIIACQLSYNFTNQLHITNAGQYVLVQSCDISPQPGAVDAAVKIEGSAFVTLSEMHIESYSGKPCIIVTDNGLGPGGTFLNLNNMATSGSGSPGYSIVATNASIQIINSFFSSVSDGTFPIIYNGDITRFLSDRSVISRVVAGANIATNYLGGGMIPGKNQGTIGSYIREGEFVREVSDFNNNPGGGIGGGYILSQLYYGARTFDDDGSLGVTPINVLSYYKDRTVNGAGIQSTNGFKAGSTTAGTFSVNSAGTLSSVTITATAAAGYTGDASKMTNIVVGPKASNYNIQNTDFLVLMNGNLSATLPTAVGIPGKMFIIMDVSAGTNAINTTSSQTFIGPKGVSGVTSVTNSTVGNSTWVVSDNANWKIVKSDY